ncbi:MAG: type II CAAX endopeptidase family protein [Sphingomonadales bacterium]
MNNIKLPLLAVAVAIAITATMDFTGYWMYSALPLIALTLIFWLIQRQSRTEIGLTLGKPKHYAMALSYPAVVLSLAAAAAYFSGDFSLSETGWDIHFWNIAIGSSLGVLMVILTEEGFFRGWLWGAFKQAKLSEIKILIITSLLFTAWHVPAVTSGTDYGLPWAQVPVYLVNALLMGLIWGLMRLISGSVIVSSVCHAVWNAFAYGLFGFGTKVGALGIENTALFGPEVGYLGLALNGAFFFWLFTKAKKSGAL